MGRRAAPLGSLRMTDFDAVRSELRGILQLLIGVGSVGTMWTLVVAGVRGGQQDVALNAANFARWARTVSPQEWQKLAWCLFLDVVGAFPEIMLPGPTGEALDVLWAPLYAFLLFQTFGGRPFLYKSVLAAAGFLEEVLPFTDFIPSATIGWFLESSSDSARKEVISRAEESLRQIDRKVSSRTGKRSPEGDR